MIDKEKIKKIFSKRTIIIASILVILVGIPIAVYIITKNASNPQAGWYNSSWNYRRSISVANTSGSTLTNEEVLVEVDTSTMISNSKLQTDCGDLRFVDNDDSTVLTYWIEGGCNTTTTQIWIRIPSLASSGTTIYMYYGNSSATDGETSWTGNFILLSTVSCPTGWTTSSDFDNKFPLGSSIYGTIGDGTHVHSQASCTTGSPSSYSYIISCGDTCGSRGYGDHTHTNAKVSINSGTVTPPYLSMIYCTNTDLLLYDGSVYISDTASEPSNTSRFSSLDNKYPMGSSTYGTTGGSDTHRHSTTGGYSTGSTTMAAWGNANIDGSNSAAPSTHSHTSSNSNTGYASNNIAYWTAYYLENTTNRYPEGGEIVMYDVLPPLGWTRFSELDDSFPLGSSTPGTTGGGTHRHSVTISTGSSSGSALSIFNSGTAQVRPPSSHTHSCSTNTSYVTALPAYNSVIYAKRNESETTIVGSTEDNVNTGPSAPTGLLVEGLNNPTTVSDTTPEFSAIFNDSNSEDYSNYYEIQVNTASDFSGTSMWDSTKTSMTATNAGSRCPDVSYAGTSLTSGVTYYWRISFWDSSDAQSSWSGTAYFSLNQTPTAPTNLYTEGSTNPTTVSDPTPELSAIYNDPDSSDTANYYEVEVNTASDFSGTVMRDSGKVSMTSVTQGNRSSDLSYAGSELANDGTIYYWRIRFWDSGDTVSPWSNVANFKMNQVPTAPTNLYTEGSTNPTKVLDTTPEFSAVYNDPDLSDTAIYYQIEVNTLSDFSGDLVWDSSKTSITSIAQGNRSSDISYNGTTLEEDGTTYYWKIKFWDAGDEEGTFSSIAQFTMNSAPNTPTNLFIDEQVNPTGISKSPKFSALYSDPNGDNASYYQIEVNTLANFTGTVMWDSTKTSTSITSGTRSANVTYSGTTLSHTGTTYYVRMRFWDSDDNASNYATGQFTDSLSYFNASGLQLEGIKIN